MPYIEDLTPYTYTAAEDWPMLNVGWLNSKHYFPVGEISPPLADLLHNLCKRPVALHRGYHCCDLCPSNIRKPADADEDWSRHREWYGNGQIRIQHRNGTWFAAP